MATRITLTATAANLLTYASAEIARLGLGDSPTNCHGVAALEAAGGVRLSDGVGLDVVCSTTEEIDRELAAMAEWYAEADYPPAWPGKE